MVEKMRIGKQDFQFGERTYVMGILNVTPDSFSDGGSYYDMKAALEHAEKMIADGADIIDVGGESTRPNYFKISVEEEISRVVPIISELKKHFDVPISIDTYKSQVAKQAILAGADLVNDIWGLKYDINMAEVIKHGEVPVCIMHNREQPNYVNFLPDVIEDLRQSVQIALEADIDPGKIILDPGVGFGKTYEMNLAVIRELEVFQQLDMPILLGTSRKSVIGLTLELPVTERDEGTLATSVIATMKGCQFVRVHDVKGNVRAIRMTQAILQGNAR